MSHSDEPLFSLHEHALEKDKGVCPQCGNNLVIKHGKAGAFFSCSTYPKCDYTRSVVEHERVADKLLVGSKCPLCEHPLAVKQGRYGMFIGCSNFPNCHHIEESNQQEEVGVACPSCKSKHKVGELTERTNRFGKTFYSCDQYPKCKYVLNHLPVEQTCPLCNWSVLIKRTMANGDVLSCPQKKCTYKAKVL